MADEQKQLAQQILLQQLEFLLEDKDTSALRQLLSEQRSSDIAEVIVLLDNEQRRLILDVLDDEIAAEVWKRSTRQLALNSSTCSAARK